MFAGLAALVALAALVGGVPFGLIRLAGPPVPEGLFDLDVFTSQVGPETIIAVLVLLVWLAWLQLVICVIVEVYAAIRRIGMPARVPLAGGTQALANRLVGAVLVLFTATAVAVPFARVATAPPIQSHLTAQTTPVLAPAAEDRPALQPREVKKVYVVQPPHGRHHESLWEIAEKCLGDGRRYPEIYQLNQHKEQPDGSRLHMADLIRPGWVLDMPDDARNVHIVSADDNRRDILSDHPGPPTDLDATRPALPDANDLRDNPRISNPDAGRWESRPDASESRPDSGRSESRPDVSESRPDAGKPDAGKSGSDGDGRGQPGGVDSRTPGGAEQDITRPDTGEVGTGQAGNESADRDDSPTRPRITLPDSAWPDQKGDPKAQSGDSKSGASAESSTGDSRSSGDVAAESGKSLAESKSSGDRFDEGAERDNSPTRPAGVDGGAVQDVPAVDAVAEPEEAAAGLDLVDYLAGASLLSAGLLALLGRRRREQLWRRAFGYRVVRPRGDAASAEVAIRIGSDAPGSRMLDSGLRLLGRLLADADRRPPAIYGVHLSSRSMDLWIHPPDRNAPEPWEVADDGQVWRLAAHEGRRIDENTMSDVPAPYPGLVSLGTGGGGRVLIDLEAAHGVISMTGPNTLAALSALAVELATNRWSDQMRITLVGFGEELSLIAPDRVRVAASLAEVLPELEEQAQDQPGDVLTGRIHGRAHDPAWPPHYLLSAIQPTAEEARRLALLSKGTRTASGFVVAGAVPHATWTWEITEDGRALVETLGFDVDAQLLPRRHYQAVVDLFRTAGRTEGEPRSESWQDPREPYRADMPPAIEVRILGPIEISPVNMLEEGRASLAQELVVYLATHPGGVHPVVLGGVLWPRGVQPMVRDATIARVAQWLGKDSRGRSYLYTDESGRLRLSPEVRTDWDLFRDLVRRGDAASLERALGLVRGPLLNARPGNRYAWLAADSLEYDVTAAVADAAHRVCETRLDRREPDMAVAAARAGLLLAPDDEALWRDLLRAAHATGDHARLRAVVDALHRRAASHPYGGGMAPQTEALIDELFPAWRRTTAPDLRAPRLA
ncbi:hypothetical protein Aph01nite_02870 [Acrocarpospora phusangensis]|uniref:Bacterial transcriptional activator domain-containing protein n=1 Tax=Acrocarpospora phusangensis TaxID=1070424 RepID=A0A919ULB0_9ACTN|nr:hypothetical protein [Acrocarpospora phusangensis]GIH21977.1 hypothetical protein Aph01nite_02870 [Acrocarpospora phusangensis]